MASSVNDCPDENNQVPSWLLATKGIKMLINNKAQEAQELFSRYPDNIHMFAGYSFAVFMDALMTFEEDKLNLAISVLKEVERKCTSESGWLRSVRKAFGSTELHQQPLEESLETQIILADSQVCLGILTFLQQEISGYFKGGWVLRKAWKIYESSYQEILQLHKEVAELEATSDTSLNDATAPHNGKSQKIDKFTIERLMGAVSFGYGLFQLGISLLPPSLLKLINFFGFGGNREDGIACLMYARRGADMRAPLATLSLLWYHTIVRPFYALDGSNVQAGVNAAIELLQESESEFFESALFLFFKGRVNRLNSDIPTALRAFQMAVDNASQREIKILALHEVGWCHLIQLDYCGAEDTFIYLKSWSRWSRAFYSYLAGICSGSCPRSSNHANLKEIRCILAGGGRNNQLDEFLARRAKLCPSDDSILFQLSPIYWKLFVYEMLYLWNALPSCSPENIETVKKDCDNVIIEPMVGLSQLILGCCYCVQRNYLEGMTKFRNCLEQRKHLPHNASDAHISAFSQYELGALLVKGDNTKAEGKTLLQNISLFKDYDFEQRLNVRVHSMLKHL